MNPLAGILPPLNFSGGMASGGTAGGGTSGGGNAFGSGDWNVNVSGAGPSLQGATSSSTLLWVAVALGAAWLLMRK